MYSKRPTLQPHKRTKTDINQLQHSPHSPLQQLVHRPSPLGFCLPSIASELQQQHRSSGNSVRPEDEVMLSRVSIISERRRIYGSISDQENRDPTERESRFKKQTSRCNSQLSQMFLHRDSQINKLSVRMSTIKANCLQRYNFLKYRKGKQLIQAIQQCLLQSSSPSPSFWWSTPEQSLFCPQVGIDLQTLKTMFASRNLTDPSVCLYRCYYSQITHPLAKLVMFMGLQPIYRLQQPFFLDSEWLQKMVRCLHYQIYLSIMYRVYNVALQALIECARLYSARNQFQVSEYFCEIGLKIAVRQSKDYYKESALEHIAFCLYKQGKVEEAKLLHDNLSKINAEGRSRILKSYNEPKYLASLKNYLIYGTQLNTQRNVKLIETIGFEEGTQDKGLDQGGQGGDRMRVLRTNRCIHSFRKSEQKRGDVKQQVNEKVIKLLKLRYLGHRDSESQAERQESERSKGDLNANGNSNANSNCVLKQHQTFNIRKGRATKVISNEEEAERNLKNFRLFLELLEKVLLREGNR